MTGILHKIPLYGKQACQKLVYAVLLGLVSLTLFARPLWSAPRIVSESNRIDLGLVRNGQLVERQFELRNDGDSDLQIDAIRACCGVTATLEKQILKPGERTVIRVSFKAEVKSGVVSRSVYLTTNDLHARHYQLLLTGRVESSDNDLFDDTSMNDGGNDLDTNRSVMDEEELIVVPRQLTLGVSKADSIRGQSRFLAIQSRRKLPFAITDVDIPGHHASYRLTALGESAWRVELRDVEKLSVDNNEEFIVIHTDRKQQARLHVPIRRMPN